LLPAFFPDRDFIYHHVEVLVVADEFSFEFGAISEPDGDGLADAESQQVERAVVVVHR